MTNISETVKLPLKLLIDKDKNKVIVAEAGKDFVDVLFSFLTLPMGTIVRLLEKHRTSPQVVVGCFNNLYKSVSDMGLESFQTESAMQLLLYPRSVKHDEYTRIKLKIDDTEPVKYFVCPQFRYREPCGRFYSISNTEECGCVNSESIKELMKMEILRFKEDQVQGSFLRNDCVDTSLFMITDDLKVASSSVGYVLNTLKDLGYKDTYNLDEISLDFGFNEVLTLMQCLFTSDFPLTDTFLKKQSSFLKTTSRLIPLNPSMQGTKDHTITFKTFARKHERKLLCVECGADFIDLLFTFLALPLEHVWEISAKDLRLGCIGNLFRSFKSLNKEANSSSSSKYLLPSYYRCHQQLLDIVTEKSEIYHSFKHGFGGETYDHTFTRNMPDCQRRESRVLDMKNLGFVKRCMRFLVTDDLVITPVSNSNINLLNLTIHLEEKDIEEQVITIGKAEAISLLRASLMTSSALTTCLWNFMSKKIKEET